MIVYSTIAVIIFSLLIILDLRVFPRLSPTIRIEECLLCVVLWTVCGLVFGVVVYAVYQVRGYEPGAAEAAGQFLGTYIVERSISMVNVFLIACIFTQYGISLPSQIRILFWGILFAVAMRMIGAVAGTSILSRFPWTGYAMGALLIASAIRSLGFRRMDMGSRENHLIRMIRRRIPLAAKDQGRRLFVFEGERRSITPLFLALLMVGSIDLAFAFDSVPAALAITRDPFCVITANAFALLGLRALYFLIAAFINRFRYMKMSVSFVLMFLGIKMILVDQVLIPTPLTLIIVAGIGSTGIIAEILGAHRDTEPFISPIADEIETMAELTWRQVSRVVIIITGVCLLLLGLVLLVTPGPGMLLIVTGLAILATQFVWANRMILWIRLRIAAFVERIRLKRPRR